MSTTTRLIDDNLFGDSIDELNMIDSDLLKKFKTNKKRKLTTTIIPSSSSSSSSSSNIVSNYYNNSHDLDNHINVNHNHTSKNITSTSKSSPSSPSSSSSSSVVLHTDTNNDNNDNFNPNFHNMFKNNKDNMLFIWLELNGTTCYSNKQLNSGIDLINIKKKYRNMK